MDKLLEEALAQFEEESIRLRLIRPLSSGKEAVVYLVEWEGGLHALKVYKDYLTRSFQSNQEYVSGKHFQRMSEKRAVQKRNKFGKKLMHRLWVKREFYMLKKLFDKNADIPEPVKMVRNAILMQYIGDESNPAPLLHSIEVTPTQAKRIYKTVQKNIGIFGDVGIVHGDLSPFNILYWNEEIYIIDFPQSADIRNNPNAEELLQRDRDRIDEWYGKYEL